MKLFILCFFSSAGLFLAGCSAHANLTPAGKGNAEVYAGVGGPFITVSDTKIPAPYITLGGIYGLRNDLNAEAVVHVTSLMYKVAGLDLGVAWFPLQNEVIEPVIGIQPKVFILASLKSEVESRFRIYPVLSASAAWRISKSMVYTGIDMLYLTYKADYEKQTPPLILSPFTGLRFPVSEKMNLGCELKWQAANVEGYQLAPEYICVGKYGALSVMFSLSRSL